MYTLRNFPCYTELFKSIILSKYLHKILSSSCTRFYFSVFLYQGVMTGLLFVVVVQLLSCVQLFATPWTAACQASLFFTVSQSLLKLMSIESVIPSNHFILYCSLFFLPSIFPSIRVFSNELALCIKWPKYWSFSFSNNPSNEYSVLISFGIN